MQLPDHYPADQFSQLFKKLWKCHKRFVLNYGGTAAGKSYSAAQKEVIYADQQPIKTLVIRKVGNTLRDSVVPSFRARISELGIDERFAYNKSDRVLTNKETGAQIVFRGLDDPDKLKSFEGLTRILVEEAAELDFEDFLELNRRARGKENIQITLTFNPMDEEHWIKKHFFDCDNDDADILHSTYKDNPHLTDEDRKHIEQIRQYDHNQYRVYALGEWGIKVNNSPWLYAFEKEKHVVEKLPLMQQYPVYLSFDFNRDPLTCIAAQMSPHTGQSNSFVHIIREFSGKITLEEMCRRINTAFPGYILFVTGDASGRRGDVSMNKTHDTYYRMIQSYLQLGNRQLNISSRNLPLAESRLLINTLFTRYPQISISNRECPLLINDCIIAKTDPDSQHPGALLKDRRQYKLDLFDAMRYLFHQYFADYADKVVLRKRA